MISSNTKAQFRVVELNLDPKEVGLKVGSTAEGYHDGSPDNEDPIVWNEYFIGIDGWCRGLTGMGSGAPIDPDTPEYCLFFKVELVDDDVPVQ